MSNWRKFSIHIYLFHMRNVTSLFGNDKVTKNICFGLKQMLILDLSKSIGLLFLEVLYQRYLRNIFIYCKAVASAYMTDSSWGEVRFVVYDV